ncbi:hypothetical protein F2P56_030990 [Juglans regia]|uniref:S-norcoclaurine synthase 2-like n=2 Tax=Juglans regia TaxID=51240 RepID=A0A2I4DXA4_JUGRE|nr:S-norcoclaurine synthase 2-like [Juglans regia]KAF5450659.1 hypothetical protein F2P56_030990 [Juglans regia]
MVVGQLYHEMEVKVVARQAWELYGTLLLSKLAKESLSGLVEKSEVLEGDGGVGTKMKITLVPGSASFRTLIEEFTNVDNEKYVKEAEVIEAGYLDLGFTYYRVRFEINEKGDDSSVIKTTVDYDVKEEAAANASYVNIEPMLKIAEATKKYLLENKAAKSAH